MCARRLFLQAFVTTLIILAGGGHGLTQQAGKAVDFESCRAISDNAARLRCYESLIPSGKKAEQSAAELSGGWHLVRTPNPQGGAAAVSVMHTADTARSDADMAGLMLRCKVGGIDVVLVTIRPFSFRAHPRVTVTSGGVDMRFDASIGPPGAAILLPNEASALAHGAWQSASELAIRIEDGQDTVRGIIVIDGLRTALQRLEANCLAQ
jgi:hypothetical protein